MDSRVSQELFQTMATPKFSAIGYLKMEFIEKNNLSVAILKKRLLIIPKVPANQNKI